ncbi:MAG: glycosyltransferase involved in cell wall biosynthesis [Motiliproteus sp.]|jgi:glycosyltransferase involved in cell wall biosynthesis
MTGRATNVSHLLMIAFHYPPAGYGSGIHRTLAFANLLAAKGWRPCVLTLNPRAYPGRCSGSEVRAAPEIKVLRAFALDSKRHLAIAGRYPEFLALPDRWSSWIIPAVVRGLWEIRRQQATALWSTYPIASAHLIGLILKRLTSLPWIADFRDPMIDAGYPISKNQRRVAAWIEKQTLYAADYCVFTTQETRQHYQQKYPDLNHQHFRVIANGYDETAFAHAPARQPSTGPVKILHSGLLDPEDRDPQALFQALRTLIQHSGLVEVVIWLRATGHDAQIQALIDQYALSEYVRILPALPYHAAIAEMMSVDVLLLLQGSSCSTQIPAKMYEYFRSHRPLLALCAPDSATERELINAGARYIAAIDNSAAIKECLASLLENLKSDDNSGAISAAQASGYDRQLSSQAFCQLLQELGSTK